MQGTLCPLPILWVCACSHSLRSPSLRLLGDCGVREHH